MFLDCISIDIDMNINIDIWYRYHFQTNILKKMDSTKTT